MKNISKGSLLSVRIPLPPTLAEQEAIAEALSDADAHIESLEQLIAKKRLVKQGAMQELLTRKRRLPGFSGEWEVKRVGEFTDCTAGGTPSTLIPEYWDGNIRWMNSGELHLKKVEEVEGRITEEGLVNSSTKLIPEKCVLVGLAGQGKTRGTVAMNLVPLCTNQSIAAIYPNQSYISDYLYHNLDSRYEELREISTGEGGRGGLNLSIIRSIIIPFPSIVEQIAIAAVLSDMDAEIAALEEKLAKARLVKQGMMQELLTGRIRLVDAIIDAESDSAKHETPKRSHNWAFNEAVVISILTERFSTKEFPLGRKRYTKLSYLMHRHVEHKAEGYSKKAAGPYNPDTKYRGPEKIAKERNYIQEHNSGKYQGFVVSNNIDEAMAYFNKWYGPNVLSWLDRFRFMNNEKLELLTTVDMAASELNDKGEEVNVNSIRDLIAAAPEWLPKLDRSVFSDENIQAALDECHVLFTG